MIQNRNIKIMWGMIVTGAYEINQYVDSDIVIPAEKLADLKRARAYMLKIMRYYNFGTDDFTDKEKATIKNRLYNQNFKGTNKACHDVGMPDNDLKHLNIINCVSEAIMECRNSIKNLDKKRTTTETLITSKFSIVIIVFFISGTK